METRTAINSVEVRVDQMFKDMVAEYGLKFGDIK